MVKILLSVGKMSGAGGRMHKLVESAVNSGLVY
jgi:hypothetical protein